MYEDVEFLQAKCYTSIRTTLGKRKEFKGGIEI